MNRIIVILFVILISALVKADPPWAIKVDFDGAAPPKIQLFEKNVRTLTVTLLNKTNINCTGSYPLYYFFDTNLNCTTCTCSWVNSTSSIFTASIQSNQLAVSGDYTYGAGISNSAGVTIAQRSTLKIIPDPNR